MDPFVAEIRIVPFNFAPKGWAFCDGQLLPLSQNTALFALLGTVYGGDGKSTFALPNLQGSACMHPGQGPGLSQRFLGEQSGTSDVTLLESEMPAHQHFFQVNATTDSSLGSAQGNVIGKSRYDDGQGNTGQVSTFSAQPTTTQLQFNALALAGGSLPHSNMQPYLTLNYVIALQGVFPARP